MKFTMTKLVAAIQEGRGSGNSNAYRPWIEVTRSTSSPYSNLSVVPVPHLTRLTHYLSRGERQFALFLWWLGATDVREQYPLWPWEHLHPGTQIGAASKDCFHPGTRQIAREAGISLPNYPGLAVPWVLSIDLIATVPAAINPSRLVGISCKPKEILASDSPSNKELERLELDRRYCLHAKLPHCVAHPEQLPRQLLKQLHWLSPIESFSALSELRKSLQYKTYVERLTQTGYDRPAWIASKEAGKHVGWPVHLEQRAMKVAMWYQDVDVDVSKPAPTTRPFIAGGTAYRDLARKQWLGRAA
ncbi:MAG: TnsA endonuclease N-terminal domain-containing protein [Acidobacteria bacterium]|nr:TnsA endonuclease N-terminal domain-containing protein [Acidobacteriota bacterium]